MDWWIKQFFFNLLPAAPWIILSVSVLLILSFGPLGKALVHRLRHGAADPRLGEAIDQIASLRQELAQVHERLDFAERLLVERQPGKDVPRIGVPRPENREATPV